MNVFKDTSDTFEILSEALSEGVVIVDKNQNIVATNSSTDEMFGYGANELKGQKLQILIPQRHHPSHDGHFKGYMKNSAKRQMGKERELYGAKKGGNIFPVEVGLNPFTIYGETYIMALVIDISERKIAEQELKHWAKVFDESLNEIYLFDAESFQFINVNIGAQRNMGYSIEEFKLLTPVDIKPDYNIKTFQKVVKPLLEKESSKLVFETIHQRKDSTMYPVEVHLQMSILGDKEVFMAIIMDITDRKNYTEKLEQTVQKRTKQLTKALAKEKELGELKTRFLSLVSHEFKTPLSSILTSTTLISKYITSEEQEKRNKHLNTIKNKVKYLDTILTDFLSVERLESGKVIYNYTRFPLSKMVNEVVYDANMLLKTGQDIEYPLNVADVIIEFDEKILELILSNLVHNAIKYSPENSKIEIKVEEDKEKVIIDVVDKGMGIPKEDQKHIFNRYFRAKNALLTQGTGIGLNIVKGHLENLGGSINFISRENIGSTFSIRIPIFKKQHI